MNDSVSKSKKPFYKKWWFWVIVVLVLIIGAAGSGDESSNSNESSGTEQAAEEQETALVVSAVDLYAAYEANEISADETYKGKLVIVTGKISDIGKDILDKPYITLEAENPFLNVQCMLADEATAEAGTASVGSSVTLQGRVSGKTGNVLVRDCLFVTE